LRVVVKNTVQIIFLAPYIKKFLKIVISLSQPVTMEIRSNSGPFVDGVYPLDTAEVLYPGKFVLAGEVVADVVEVDFPVLGGLGVLYQERDGDGGAGAAAEDLAAFLAGLFTGGALVAAQVEDVNTGELLGEAFSEAISRISFDEACIGDETDDAASADAIRGPADGADVTVVEVFHRGHL